MNSHRWISLLARVIFGRRTPQNKSRPRRCSNRPVLQVLENRLAPATLTLPSTDLPTFVATFNIMEAGNPVQVDEPIAGGNFLGTLNSTQLTSTYCVNIDEQLNSLPTTYSNAAVTSDGTAYGMAVPNAGAIAWLITNLGPAATTTTDQDALQAAIWRTEYGPSGFQLDGVDNTNGAPAFNATVGVPYQADLAALGSNTEPVSMISWISPGLNTDNITTGQPLAAIPAQATTPTITVNPNSLNLGTTTQGTAGSPQSYTVSGNNLTAGIVITPPTGVQIAMGSGAFQTTALTLTPSSGTVAATTINVEITPTAPLGNLSGSITDTSTGATEMDVALTGTVNAATTPTITVNPNSLNLGTTTTGTAGSEQSYTVSGSDLTAGIVITPPTGVQIAEGSGTFQTTPLTVAESGGTVADTTINVEITSTAAVGPVSGNITNASTGATTQDVSVSGTVNAVATPTITVNPNSLNLGTTTTGTAGSEQSYTVSGSDLTAGIVITPPTGVQIAEGSGTFQTTPLTVAESGGTVADTTINVEITSTAAVGPVSGNITNASTGATTQDVSVSGTVTNVVTAENATTSVALDASGNLVVTDIAPGGKNDNLTLQSDNANTQFIIADPTAIFEIIGTIPAPPWPRTRSP